MTATPSFTREESGGRLLGYSLQHKHAFLFFGSKNIDKAGLTQVYPEYEYAFLKQVHGNRIVAADSAQEAEADGHFTSRMVRAPVVQTADCLPLLLVSKNRVCAIHSGWRGTAQNITAAAARCFDEPVLFAAIGPHILAASFEVGRDVAAQLMKAAPDSSDPGRYQLAHPDSNKVYFDMTQLVRDQIHAAFGARVQILECLHDTKTSSDFHSFRRDGKTGGRQYSFVVLNS